MRKLLASTLGVGVALAPAAIAAEPSATDDTNPLTTPVTGTDMLAATHAGFRPLLRVRLERDAAEQLRQARERAERKRERERRAKRRRAQRRAAAARGSATSTPTGAAQGGGGATPGHLQAIAACESGGNPSAIGGGGAYRGKYQFSYETWASVGGSGDPAAASEAEQDRRAAILYSQAGASPWPTCGR